jgi:hypothetical protein
MLNPVRAVLPLLLKIVVLHFRMKGDSGIINW